MPCRQRKSDLAWLAQVPVLAGMLMVGLILLLRKFGVNLSEATNFATGLVVTTILLLLSLWFIYRVIKARSSAPAEGASSQITKGPPAATTYLQQLRALDWFQFEQVVGIIYRQRGFQVSRRGGANPDGGIDLLLTKDQHTIGVQCKHWKNQLVGVREIREFLGALTAERVPAGIFVTLHGYTPDARQLANSQGIILISEAELSDMLESVVARANPELIQALNNPVKRCPKCESEMVLRQATKGPNIGNEFWGCSRFPACRYIMQ
jgi:restriction system protein